MINLIPLAPWSDVVLLLIRFIAGTAMIYYGWPKIRDLKANAKDFEKMGFRPGMLHGTAVAIIEFFGGFLVIFGIYIWVAAAAFGFEMLMGALWKITKTNKPYTDWSYDLLLFALMLVFLITGPGAYAISNLL